LSPFKVVYGIDPLIPLDLVPRAIDEKPSVEARKEWRKFKNAMSSRPRLRSLMLSTKPKQTTRR